MATCAGTPVAAADDADAAGGKFVAAAAAADAAAAAAAADLGCLHCKDYHKYPSSHSHGKPSEATFDLRAPVLKSVHASAPLSYCVFDFGFLRGPSHPLVLAGGVHLFGLARSWACNGCMAARKLSCWVSLHCNHVAYTDGTGTAWTSNHHRIHLHDTDCKSTETESATI